MPGSPGIAGEWDPARLDELIRAAAPATLYLCGGADNQLELADRFTQVFLLEIDEPTMLVRLDTRQDNEWGRAGDSREYIRRLLPGYQDRLRAFGAIPIDASKPLDQVVDAILSCTLASSPTNRGQQARQSPRQSRHTLETVKHARLMKITSLRPRTGPDLRGKLGAPSATRTRDLLLRRHNRPSAVQNSSNARHQRAEQPKAVAARTILLWPREQVPQAPRAAAAALSAPRLALGRW